MYETVFQSHTMNIGDWANPKNVNVFQVIQCKETIYIYLHIPSIGLFPVGNEQI